MQERIGRDGLPVVQPADYGTERDNRTQEQIADDDAKKIIESFRRHVAEGRQVRY
jgi:hypothetical protein